MIAEIVCIGTELLMGQVLNTDAQYLSRRLSELGITLYRQSTVGDNPARMREAIKTALSRADIVITTGGLGPTMDDLTKQIIAECFDLPMEADKESVRRISGYFAAAGRAMTKNNLRQAMFPKGAHILKNEKGTAPGCVVERDGKLAAALPGPPFELQDMFDNALRPYLEKKRDAVFVSRYINIFGIGESQMEDRIADIIAAQTNPTIAPYVGAGYVMLRLTASAKDERLANDMLDPVEREITGRLGEHVFSARGETMEQVAVRLLKERGLKAAAAESLTGGKVADLLIQVPGASEVFLEGAVTYSNESKTRGLSVREDTLARFGAVSAQTAREMAQGMLLISGADIALSTTGIAGPGGATEEKPVGLVYIAVAHRGGVRDIRLNLRGDRERVRSLSAMHALNELRKTLLGLKNIEGKEGERI